MTDFGRRAADMFKSVYDTDNDGRVDVVEAQISDLDHDAQKIKGVSVDDSAIADGKVLTYQTASGKIEYITPAPSGAVLNNIQFCDVDVADGESYHDCTITAVDMDKTILIPAGQQYSNLVDRGAFTCILLNTTTVRVQRNSSTDLRNVKLFVVEFSSGINSVQRGISTLANTGTLDVDITAVDLDKAFITYTGARNLNADWNRVPCRIEFKDADTITIYRNQDTGTIYCSWEVVEFE